MPKPRGILGRSNPQMEGNMRALHSLVVVLSLALAGVAQHPNPPAQGQPAPQQTEQVRPISAPRHPLPPEDQTKDVTRFAFLVYGDTRGRRDGIDPQYEHSLIVDSMLAAIKRLENSPNPVKFVLQTGDAVVNGRDPRQWNASFVGLINRLTGDGGVPYFLAPGNHDVTGAPSADAPIRQEGLRNYLDAIAQLIPPDGTSRRLSGYPTYAFGYGNTFVIAFDSNIASDDTQFNWVRSQLEGLDRKRFANAIAFCHHPAFSSGPHGGARIEPPTAGVRERYLPLFRKHRVSVVFSGHEHFFEHWVERYQDESGKKIRLDHVVTGGGGAPLYSFQGRPELRPYTSANSSDKVEVEQLSRPGIDPGDNAYHYVIVRVDGTRLRLEVIGVDWGAGFQPYRSRRADLADPQ
jgi:hypothetical protein